jgi:hypothetical protein
MEHANGRLLQPRQLAWAGFTTAGHPEILGPPFGVLKVVADQDWITLTPLDGETESEWNERAGKYNRRVDDLMATAYDSALPYARAVVEAEEQREDFKRDSLPAILEALQLVQAREAPRERHRCQSC